MPGRANAGAGGDGRGQASSTQWVLAGVLPCLALLVATPWVAQAHPVWDWAELVPIFQASGSLQESVSRLAEVYGREGRANNLAYWQLALGWQISGGSALGWQVQRAVLMLVPALLFVLAARRMGATPIVAGLGGALVSVGASAMEGWTLLMGEPLGVVLLLVMVHLSLGYRETDHWQARAACLGVLALAVMQVKEILGVCIPFVLVLAVCHQPGQGLRLPRLDRRTIWLSGSMALALAIEMALLLPVLARLDGGSYAGGYGAEGLGLDRAGRLTLAMLLPTWFHGSGPGSLLYPANAAAVLLLLLGGGHLLRHRPERIPGVFALAVLPVVGAMVYAPWPRYAPFYGMPFWFAGAGLLVAAGSALARGSRVGAAAAAGLMTIAFAFTAIAADRALKERHAHSALAEDLVHELPEWTGVDSIFVVGPASGPRRWPVTGPELRRYAVALGADSARVPPIVDLGCAGAAARLREGLARAALINSAQSCGALPIRTGVHVSRYRYRDWLDLSTRRDSVVLESLVPSRVPRP